MNKGGTVMLGEVAVTMVNAVHSSSVTGEGGKPVYSGAEAGYMLSAGGRTLYIAGDTDVMADMAWMGEYYAPDLGILSCGGHYTMDQKAAAWAAKKYFNFKTVIPCHYKTFPILAQDAKTLVEELPDVDVKVMEVLETVDL